LKKKNSNIDIGLSVLCAHNNNGQRLSHADIAEVCGCSSRYICEIEQKALAKLQKFFRLKGLSAIDYLEK